MLEDHVKNGLTDQRPKQFKTCSHCKALRRNFPRIIRTHSGELGVWVILAITTVNPCRESSWKLTSAVRDVMWNTKFGSDRLRARTNSKSQIDYIERSFMASTPCENGVYSLQRVLNTG